MLELHDRLLERPVEPLAHEAAPADRRVYVLLEPQWQAKRAGPGAASKLRLWALEREALPERLRVDQKLYREVITDERMALQTLLEQRLEGRPLRVLNR